MIIEKVEQEINLYTQHVLAETREERCNASYQRPPVFRGYVTPAPLRYSLLKDVSAQRSSKRIDEYCKTSSMSNLKRFS